MARAPRQNGLDEMTVKELLELEQSVTAAIAARQQSERAELKAKFAQLASDAGFSIDEILGLRKARGTATKAAVAAKYRNPENPAETWVGRGRKPNWLVEKLKKSGATIEAFAI